MSATSFDSMPASRELDALVAEVVMEQPKLVSLAAFAKHALDANGSCLLCGLHKAKTGDYCIPPYSTSIAASWEVVERFERGAFASDQVAAYVRLNCSDGIESERYSCELASPSLAAVSATGRTMPEAICRAALKAVVGSK